MDEDTVSEEPLGQREDQDAPVTPEQVARNLAGATAREIADEIGELEGELAAEVILELPEEQPQRVLGELADREVLDLALSAEDDVAVDLLELLVPERQLRLFNAFPDELEELGALLEYSGESAAGNMTTNFVALAESTSVESAVRTLRRRRKRSERDIHFVHTTDEDGKLLRQIPVEELLFAAGTTPLKELEGRTAIRVRDDVDQERAALLFKEQELSVLPVVDDDDRLIGVMTPEDVLGVFEEESEEDLLRFAGISEEETGITPARVIIKNRLPWLALNLATAFGAAIVVRFYEGTIEQAVILAFFMPVIAGMGGNAATQALGVTIRGLAAGTLTAKRYLIFIYKEFSAGFVLGVGLGAMASVVALVLSNSWWLVLVVFLSMVITHVVAAVFGSLIPLILDRYGLDPAVASSIFITTLTDVFGFLSLLGLASWLLIPKLAG